MGELFNIINYGKYKINPMGLCPMQAEGKLPTGEFYYIRYDDTGVVELELAINEDDLIMNPLYRSEIKFDEMAVHGSLFLKVAELGEQLIDQYYETTPQ